MVKYDIHLFVLSYKDIFRFVVHLFAKSSGEQADYILSIRIRRKIEEIDTFLHHRLNEIYFSAVRKTTKVK